MSVTLVFQYVLFCFAGLLTAHYVREGWRENLGHVLLHGVTALAVLVGLQVGAQSPLSLSLQAILVLIPHGLTLSLRERLQGALVRQDFETALLLARRRLHLFPFASYQRQLTLIETLAEASQRADVEGRPFSEILRELADVAGLQELRAYACAAELRRESRRKNWKGIITLYESGTVELPSRVQELGGRLLLVRAYTETNALREALLQISVLERLPRWARVRRLMHWSWVNVLAAGGRAGAVERLFQQQLGTCPRPIQAYWRARAEWAGGAGDAAQARLEAILTDEQLPTAARIMAQRSLRRLSEPPPARNRELEPQLDRIEQLVRMDALLFQDSGRWLPTHAALGAVLLTCVAVFAGMGILLSTRESLAHFAALGKLLGAEPWRLPGALLLHASWLHLLINLAALARLGDVVMGVYRASGALLILVVAGLAGTLTGVAIHPEMLQVGSSGAILGWLGALVATTWRGRVIIPRTWRRELLRSASLLFCGELMMGLAIPAVGWPTLLGGGLAGLALGLILPMAGLREAARLDPPGSVRENPGAEVLRLPES